MVACSAVGPEQLTQFYFPGGHGGVGGGDAHEEPLSDNALRFMVEEIKRRNLGLAIDMSKIPEGNVAVEAKTRNSGTLIKIVESFTGKFIRPIASVDECHHSAVKRYQLVPDWRPESLKEIGAELLAMKLDL